MRVLVSILLMSAFFHARAQSVYRKSNNQDLLPNGKKFDFWSDKTGYSRTYFVDAGASNASDSSEGTENSPFKTINKAASTVLPGERVVIKTGVYRETIVPVHAGVSPSKMIMYEAAPGHKVTVKGSAELDKSTLLPSTGWTFSAKSGSYMYTFSGKEFAGYNPFAALNIMQSRDWLDHKRADMKAHFLRRGMLYVNGVRYTQCDDHRKFADTVGVFWPEHNGMRIHIRFPDTTDVTNAIIEATVAEQVFVPRTYEMGYIHIKGIEFEHAGNGFPVPQRGMLSAARGHHWIIENCKFTEANAVGVDLGDEMWGASKSAEIGGHIIRNCTFENIGICGLAGMHADNYLIEDNYFNNCGYHNAEHAFESGGIKLHTSHNTLIRRNIIQNQRHAAGLWLDYMCGNTRVTQNLFFNITTGRGAIYVEASQLKNELDHNVIIKTRSQYWLTGDYGAGGSGIYQDGCDSLQIHHNLLHDNENASIELNTNTDRIVAGRGGVSRNHVITNNIFSKPGKVALKISNPYQFIDRNIYSKVPSGGIHLLTPESFKLNLKAMSDHFGWEKNGKAVNFDLNYNPSDFVLDGENFPVSDPAGPFESKAFSSGINIDPRLVK